MLRKVTMNLTEWDIEITNRLTKKLGIIYESAEKVARRG